MATADLRGIEIHYELGGAGPRVLFFNGSGATLAHMAPLLDMFRERFEILAADQRGLGQTAEPAAEPTMADFAQDGLALADHVGWDRFAVFGISFGGMVAQELAVTAPERIERLALVCTSPGGEGGSSYPLHDPPPDIDRAQLLDTRFSDSWLDDHPDDAAMVAGFATHSTDQTRGELFQLAARSHHDVFDRLGAITCPTLVAAGRWDGIAPLANSEAMASRIADAELRVYEGGHIFFAQDATALPDVVDFLAGTS